MEVKKYYPSVVEGASPLVPQPKPEPLPRTKTKPKPKTKLEPKCSSLENKKKLNIIYSKGFVKTSRSEFD